MALTQTVVVERPPEGLARGKWESPPWVIIIIVALCLIGTLAYAAWRLLRARKPAP